MTTYVRRLTAHGAARKGVQAYHYQVRATVRNATRLAGGVLNSTELFRDPGLLGRALTDDQAVAGAQLSKWTLAQRRSAIRSFATLMRPELRASLGEEPAAVVDRALRGVAERVGAGYRLTGGKPRSRGGVAPTREAVDDVLAQLASTLGFVGPRDRAFFGVLAATGCRVNALLRLDGAECLVLPNGRLRLYLREKGKSEHREVELGVGAAQDLHAYVEAYNRQAASRGWRARVRLGEAGRVWRNHAGRPWGYTAVRKTLRVACVSAGVPAFAPHALRRAFATDAASRLPRHVVAQAGGWHGLERLDDHYIRPRALTIWEKLDGNGRRFVAERSEVGTIDATAGAV